MSVTPICKRPKVWDDLVSVVLFTVAAALLGVASFIGGITSLPSILTTTARSGARVASAASAADDESIGLITRFIDGSVSRTSNPTGLAIDVMCSAPAPNLRSSLSRNTLASGIIFKIISFTTRTASSPCAHVCERKTWHSNSGGSFGISTHLSVEMYLSRGSLAYLRVSATLCTMEMTATTMSELITLATNMNDTATVDTTKTCFCSVDILS